MTTSVDARPTLLDGEHITGGDLRREITGAMFGGPGIVSGIAVTALPTPDMAVRMTSGRIMVDDGAGGLVPLYFDTQTDFAVAASSATQARYDSLIGEVVDTGDGATLIRRARIITGTPAGSPAPPALPYSDQPSAKTLRLANVYVQVNAETNGKVRTQDVTVVANQLSAVARPMQSTQIVAIDNPSVTAGAWTDFTEGQWPAVTFTVPASGSAFVTVAAECLNGQTDTSTARASFRMSGGYTLAAAVGRDVGGHTSVSASRRYLVTGMTAGASVTVTPAYRLSSVAVSPVVAFVHGGNLIVEPV